MKTVSITLLRVSLLLLLISFFVSNKSLANSHTKKTVYKTFFKKHHSSKKIKSRSQILSEASQSNTYADDMWEEFAEDTADDQGENDFTAKDICPVVSYSAIQNELVHLIKIFSSNPNHCHTIPLYILFHSLIIPPAV